MDRSAECQEGLYEGDVELPSCDGCRRRKLRCSREWPTCSHCRRLSSVCTYEYQRKKPGVKSGAVETLSRRVDALENAVFDVAGGARSASSVVNQPGPQVSQAHASDSHQLGSILTVLTQEIRELNSNMSTPRLREAHSIAPSPLSNHSLYHEEGYGAGPGRPRKRTRLNSNNARQGLSNEHSDNHPSLLARADVVEDLLDTYFSNIHPWIPILHETRFRAKVADGRDQNTCAIILHAILVASLRLVEDGSPTMAGADIREEVKRSRAHIVLNSMADLTLENMQALVIVVFTDIGQGDACQAWSMIGSLARTVQYLQLSVEPTDLLERAALLSHLPTLPSPADWIEEEERRRLFWNVFLLDRFCSITTGWNVSLTAEDVCRRLPIDGGLWARNQPALTPYLGIWDHSAAKIGHTTTFLPSKYDNLGRNAQHGTGIVTSATDIPDPHQINSTKSAEVLKIGAFAYYVESVESLSRINTYFVQQYIDFTNRQDVFSWLTRFKELDLRLVHWRMSLPQRWKNPNDCSDPAAITAMDPNMTLAHVTHNMSSIMLHQSIAYPSKDLQHLKLPNACSADTCFVAATETANITTKYLEHAPSKRVLAPHFAVCVFVSAKVLLVHSLHYKTELASEFWTLIKCLETMNQKWKGPMLNSECESVSLAGSFATELRKLHDLCQEETANHHKAFFRQVSHRCRDSIKATGRSDARLIVAQHREGNSVSDETPIHYRTPTSPAVRSSPLQSARPESSSPRAQRDGDFEQEDHARSFRQNDHQNAQPPSSMAEGPQTPTLDLATTDKLSAMSEGLMDQSFLEMNRIINFDDFMFITDSNELSYMNGL